jgi:hypothetical protein
MTTQAASQKMKFISKYSKGSSSRYCIEKKNNLQSLVHLSSWRVLQNEIHPSLIVEIAEKPAINIFSRPHKQSSGIPESELRIREANKLRIRPGPDLDS